MNKKTLALLILLVSVGIYYVNTNSIFEKEKNYKITDSGVIKPKYKPKNARALYAKERQEYELQMQINPSSGIVPMEEKEKELEMAMSLNIQKKVKQKSSKAYISRGPSNLGGRTRAFVVDISDTSSNTMLSGGVSSGLFRSTNGGANWIKVSPADEIHNVTAIAQDPRPGFQNIWYYGTGEWAGNSASSAGAPFLGRGVWKSIDRGLSWNRINALDNGGEIFERFDSSFDFINNLKVSPINGDLFIASTGRITRLSGSATAPIITTELVLPRPNLGFTDVVISNTGRVYAALQGNTSAGGVWCSATGNGGWNRIAQQNSPENWNAQGRIVLTAAKSANVVYALYVNGNSGGIEADLWHYNGDTRTWTDYSSKLPDEPGADLAGNDPFAVQGGYDLVVSVKPDDANFVVIGGTNAYKISNIVTEITFTRIGGYMNNQNFATYNVGGVDHHPDIHVLEFDPNNSNVLFTGTDGGIHRTPNINLNRIAWQSLNNNYITYQYYHVALDPLPGSDGVIGGAQDNGTTVGGTFFSFSDEREMEGIFGGDGVSVGLARRNNNEEIQFYAGFQNGLIFVGGSDSDSVREITPDDAPTGEDSDIFVTYFYLDPDNTENLYYSGNTELFKTNDAENITNEDWENLGSVPSNEILRTFATTRGAYNNSSYMLIGGQSGGIYRLNNPRAATSLSSAVNITPPQATTGRGSLVVGLAIHPTNPDIVLAVYSNYGIPSIFLTNNARSSSPNWELVENNLEAHSIRSAAIVESGNETVYFVGTARGLYSSTNPRSVNWQLEGPNTIGLAVVSSLVYRPADDRLLIGTHGNGMFETTIPDVLSSNRLEITNSVSLYPNPAINQLNIKSDNIDLEDNITYTILDLTGKVVSKGTVKNKVINVANLNTGTYIVNLSSKNIQHTSKFIKQ